MSATDMSAVLDILRSLYLHIRTLEEFADSLVFREGQGAVLVEPTDSDRFKSFVRTVYVCSDKELKQIPSCSQICSLPELLAFVLNSVKRKRKRNVLAHGYNFRSVAQEERDADHFKFQGDITQSAAYIHGSDLWKKVMGRLGTDITRYLLESCSVFVAVPPSCVFQVSGPPVYDRVSMATAAPRFYLQPRRNGTQTGSVLFAHWESCMGEGECVASFSTGKRRVAWDLGGYKEEIWQLLCQHRRCPYSRILQRMCPLLEERKAGQEELISLLPQRCAPHRVYLFVRECLSAVIPRELWGSDHNRLHFFARVRGFLRSGKFERLSLAELLWKMKVNDCDWLKISKTGRVPPSELSYRTRVLGQFLAWALDGFVVSLVRASFYVTESMGQKNALRFYRQEVWAKLQDLAFRGHLAKGQMEELTPTQVASLPKATVISRLRFIPKTDGMRPITRVIGADAKTRLYQSRVRDLQDMLQACARCTPSLLGCTVWGMTDIHKVLSSLAVAQKDKPQPLYFVKVDVSGAYESLPHDKLIEVVGQVLSTDHDELFTTRRYAKIWVDSHEGLKKTFVRQADFLEDNIGSTNMKGFVTSMQKKGKVHHAILVEQLFTSDLHSKEVSQFFTQMLTASVVQFGKKTYRQCRGIPQGSVVSSLLCCLCYGHMENVLFKDVSKNKGCLMRLVDDFLLITPDLHEAQNFLKILLAGVPQYGLVVNPQKVVLNFQASGSTDSCPDIRVLPPHCLFPWCGLLLDTHSLDVHKDYSSYAGLSLRYSLSLGSFHSAGQQMKRKLMSILRLKCHALFLDLKTNSLEAVYNNVYKLVLLHACRFHVCAQSLPFGQRVDKNPEYFLKMIWDMAKYGNHLIRHSNKGLNLGSKAQTGVVQYEAVELIFCLCFLLVLSQHRPLYKDLLTRLHKRKRSLERRLGDMSSQKLRHPQQLKGFKRVR
ncbi:unnamed protein product [Pleuronectes platessa]|uniref:Telomerase reverse transcriptase n=1 Tax=Pleuronectes platessa TaxID=8262 RepID=A0A9N7V5D8_PLEPL|nr:unnamed protein product [Pleuronectes platessa]